MKAAVVGTGYVGLVTGVILADLGIHTLCVDKDQAKLKILRAGRSPIYEPGLEEIQKKVMEKRLLNFTDSIAEAASYADVIFIAVGTPMDADGSADLAAVKAVAREIGKGISSYTVVVDKSTVPVGTGKAVQEILLEECGDSALFDVVSCPEFLREGSAVEDTLHPDRIVIGASSEKAAEMVKRLYASIETEFLLTDLPSAELIKYASNCFLACKISYINMISRFCEAQGGCVEDVAKGMGLDSRIGGQFLKAGLGWGGSCFPKDVSALIWMGKELGMDVSLLDAAVQINEDQPQHCLRRLSEATGGLAGKKVALWGLSFKPNTDDVRDAKSLELIKGLREMGAEIYGTDPIAIEAVQALHPDVTYLEDPLATAADADAVVLVTEWPEYAGIELNELSSVMKGNVFFDGRRQFTKAEAIEAGLVYLTIGQSN
jgi:UDPglucose 6-dehydrogenase